MNNIQNKRQYERKHVRLKGNLISEKVQRKITLVDLSENGLGFLTDHTHKIGDVIDVELTLAHNCVINLKVEIKNMITDIFANRIGAKIVEIPKNYLDYIQQFFKKQRSPLMQTLSA
ncbi:PilZ domain-containing protein [Thiomicrorhabdus indica]|uniref:PilZ domain-containing protein n=1 Tax=Thiomicrorhabdus indica TaxID=2267253 RepID=UPI00102DE1B5|nr:PilZ domain-containing protein [Thiomicrorhabdus indica]